jgi:hypothetical protein
VRIFYRSIEIKYDERLAALQSKHADELAAASSNDDIVNQETAPVVPAAPPLASNDDDTDNLDHGASSKADKARRKREKARERERQRELDIEEETANAGPSAKDIEVEQLMLQLAPLHLTMEDVTADGHCLYRAVGKECAKDYMEIRKCAVHNTYEAVGRRRALGSSAQSLASLPYPGH